jgi:Ca2+-transporting ATPase
MTVNAPAIPSGLTSSLAAERLRIDGFNELPSTKPRKVWAIAWKVVSEPMLLLLIACGVVYLLLGDLHEALVLMGFVFVIISITFFQEHKTERALEALRDLSSPRALVIRDGAQIRIAGREVVRGDLIVLSEGDRVPADAILLSCMNMTVDESLLTGESVPVSKAIAESPPQAMGQAGGDDLPFVFSGSLVVQGKGTAQVIAIGSDTAIGQIGKALFSVEEEPTRVQRETKKVVKYVAICSIILAIFLALWYGLTRGDWLNGLLVGITFAMALIPEELPVVLTLFLGIGAWRIAKMQVLTRRIPAIETLGATTVLCVDKTGTLTQNRMAVAQLFSNGRQLVCDGATPDLPEEFHEVLEYAILASHRDPFDPMEVAIQDAGKLMLGETEHLHDNWTLVNEYALSKELLAMSRVWKSNDNEHYVIASKGAPEAIADLCHLSEEQIKTLTAQVNLMAAQGLRVLGVAKAVFLAKEPLAVMPNTSAESLHENLPENLPEIQHDFDFELIGLIGLADPIRPGVTAAIKECQTAGIRVIMITGDYPATAQSIAAQCGLLSPGGVMTGAHLNALDDGKLRERIKGVNIFCRVIPEQKLRLVNVLKGAGEIVAMTGDGVNDAPALKSAHIGIAMGKRGSDVARESAALVLLDDDFSAIVAAVKLGRRIFDNLRKTVSFIVAVHVPVFGMSLIPVLMGWPIFLMPVHILVLQLIIDPTCSLVFEAETEESDVMSRPPRKADASIFATQLVFKGALQGLALLATVLTVFYLALRTGHNAEQARALGFTTMVLGNIGLILINRSLSQHVFSAITLPNPTLWWVTGSALCILSAALFVPSLSGLFYFGHPSLEHIAISILASFFCIAMLVLAKSRGYLRVT